MNEKNNCAVTDVKVENLEERFAESQNRLNGNLERIWKKLDGLEDKIVRRLPLWATLLFTLLTGATTALLVAFLRR